MSANAAPKFSTALRIKPDDIDTMGHVNNVVYVRWVQEVAEAHWHSVASAPTRHQFLWVVLRHEIDYKHPVFLNDQVTGTTWVGTHHGARFERFVTLSAESGKIFAEAKTTWCLLDSKNMKPLRIPEEILKLL
jgi:acyl-CoA thioester hydrolase